jgi:hypothetical protein
VVAAMVALVGATVLTTGAYFTDSKGGSISGNLGTVSVNISGANIDFKNLLPGVDQTQTVTVKNTGTANEDMWLVFSNDNGAWSAVNDLGAYGIFTVAGHVYDNLNNAFPAGSGPAGIISTNPDSGCYNVVRPDIAYLPHAIKLWTLVPNQVATFNIAFHFNACMTGGNGTGAPLWASVANDIPNLHANALTPLPLQFSVAAFQQGVDPQDQMNGLGRITPFTLPWPTDTRTPSQWYQW